MKAGQAHRRLAKSRRHRRCLRRRDTYLHHPRRRIQGGDIRLRRPGTPRACRAPRRSARPPRRRPPGISLHQKQTPAVMKTA